MLRCSLIDFIGYVQAVMHFMDSSGISPADASRYEVLLDGVRHVKGGAYYSVSLRELPQSHNSGS